MCRMIFATGQNLPVKIYFNALKYMASNSLLTRKHKDGWGIAYLTNPETPEWKIEKFTTPIGEAKTDMVSHIEHLRPMAVLLHVRRASKGQVAPENTHPFYNPYEHPEFVFAHNGDISDNIIYRLPFKTYGATDSERFFYTMLAFMLNNGFVGIQNLLSRLDNFIAANFILSSKSQAVIGAYYNQNKIGTKTTDGSGMSFEDCFTLRLGQSNNTIVVSSQEFDIPDTTTQWSLLPHSHIIGLDLKKCALIPNPESINFNLSLLPNARQ